MSTENESKNSSLPILHFINKSKNTESTSTHNNETKESSVDNNKAEVSTVHDNNTELSTVQDNNTEQTTENDNDEKPITTVSHARRVHFPNDDSQLRTITYTPEPLSNQPLLSLGVILQRYRAACQRLQLRPLHCLLDQLSTMDDGRKSFYDRLDCLKIINEKIDLKHIDAIEEILSRCRFHTLNFESSTIDDLALVQLFDVIEYYESCTHIILSNNRSIGLQGYQALTKYLRKTSCLERLDMNLIRFDENNILNFTRSLRLSTTLHELHVESCQLNGRILQKFIQNLRSCTCLRELYLCDNRLQVQDSLLINELIRTCGQFLFLIDLRSNAIQDNGMSHIASQLSHYDEHHTSENSLHKISFQSNQLTQQGIGFLAKSLLHNRTIHSLNLSNNNITNEGLFLLRDALLKNRTINELILRNCRLTDQAAIALAEFIAESSTIQYIDLRENTIQASGICGMAIAMKNNKSLLQLDFDPINSAPTNMSSFLNNNIDRTTNMNNLFSLTNLRRMTTGFGSFTGNTSLNSNTTNTGGGGTRALLEQKARWMNDIAAVCQRNFLIYEEKLRSQEEEQQQHKEIVNGPNENDSTIIKPEDIELKEPTLNKNPSEDNTLPITINSKNESLDIPTNDNDKIEQPIFSPVDTNDEIEQSVDISTNRDTNIEQTVATPINDNHEIEQPMTDSVDDNQDQSKSDIINKNSTFPDSPSLSDLTNDEKRQFRHSDSIYILRKKVHKENDNTSDDESQLSSIEDQQQIIDGV